MKNFNFSLKTIVLFLAGGIFVGCEIKNETANKPNVKPTTLKEKVAGRKIWEATPDGINFKKWEASIAGKKVLAGIANLRKQGTDSSDLEAVITSLKLPEGARLGYGVIIKINNFDYILNFGSLKSDEFQQLHSLKVNNKLKIKRHFLTYASKYDFPIVTGQHIERDNKIIFKRAPRKGGC